MLSSILSAVAVTKQWSISVSIEAAAATALSSSSSNGLNGIRTWYPRNNKGLGSKFQSSRVVDWKSRTAPPYNIKHNRAQRSAGQPSQQAMCKNFLRGRACFKGNRCPYFHPPHAQAHIVTTDTGLPGTDSDQHNYEHATRFDELDFQLGPNEM